MGAHLLRRRTTACPSRSSWHRSRVAFVLVAALCLIEPADAQPTAAVAGVVADATGGPLTDAAITVRGSVERSARTGADGRFAIEKLPPGDYDLTAIATGFAPARQSLRVPPGETADSHGDPGSDAAGTHRGHRHQGRRARRAHACRWP